MNLSNKFSSFAALCTLRPRVCSYRLQQRLTSKSIYPLYYNYAVGYRVCFNGEKRAFLLSIREKRFRRPLKTKGSRLERKGEIILNVAGDKIPRPPPSLSELKGAGAPLGGENMRCPFSLSPKTFLFCSKKLFPIFARSFCVLGGTVQGTRNRESPSPFLCGRPKKAFRPGDWKEGRHERRK